MALNVWPRRKANLVAPFATEGRFLSLILKESDTCVLRDPAWDDYEADRDEETLAAKRAMVFRSIFTPTLASFLDKAPASDSGALLAFADRLTAGLRRRLAASPAPMQSLVQIVVVAKAQD
jgi:hypothetical protein